MTVRFDLDVLLRQWADQDHTSMLLVFEPAQAHPPDFLVEQVDLAVQLANTATADQASSPLGDSVHGARSWLGPDGPVIFVPRADSPPVIERWLSELGMALTQQGLSGAVRPARTQAPEVARRRLPVLTALLCVSNWNVSERGQVISPWSIDRGLANHLAAWACEWVAHAPGPTYFSQGVGTFLMAPDAARVAIARAPDDSQLIWSPGPEQMRTVTFCRPGRLIVQVADAQARWQDNLSLLVDVLRQHASILELGIVRYAYSNTINTTQVVDLWPPRLPRHPAQDTPSHYYRFHRHLDHQRVPDASGVQLLTDAHLARARDLRSWRIESLGHGTHLVEAPDQEQWFSPPQPSDEVLRSAREAFGDMILWSKPDPL